MPDYKSQYEKDHYWNDDLYDQDTLEYKHNFIKPQEQNEDIITLTRIG